MFKKGKSCSNLGLRICLSNSVTEGGLRCRSPLIISPHKLGHFNPSRTAVLRRPLASFKWMLPQGHKTNRGPGVIEANMIVMVCPITSKPIRHKHVGVSCLKENHRLAHKRNGESKKWNHLTLIVKYFYSQGWIFVLLMFVRSNSLTL